MILIGQVYKEMIRRRGKESLLGVVGNAWRLALITVVAAISVVIVSAQGNARALTTRQGTSPAVISGDGHGYGDRIRIHSGNGKLNKNYSTVLSPTVNRGFQQVSNTNVSGKTSTQVGFCTKKHRVCKISQRLGGSR
jgi:hypothetical protein